MIGQGCSFGIHWQLVPSSKSQPNSGSGGANVVVVVVVGGSVVGVVVIGGRAETLVIDTYIGLMITHFHMIAS